MRNIMKRWAPLLLAFALVLGRLGSFDGQFVYASETNLDLETVLNELGYSNGMPIKGIPGQEVIMPTQEDIDYLNNKMDNHFSIQAAIVPKLNTKKEFFAFNEETNNFYKVNATLKKVGEHSLIYLEDGRDVNEAFLEKVVSEFEKIYAKNVETFGTPPDVDKDRHINILLLDIQDGLDSSSFIAGYFHGINELPAKNYPGESNECEMFYMDIVEGLAGDNEEYVTNQFFGTLAHEFQHMIQFGVFINNYSPNLDMEELWLDEGMADLAQYINGYGHPQDHVLFYLADQFNYGYGLTDWDNANPLANYGASYMFGLYMYEKLGTQFIQGLVRNPKVGIDSINDQLSKSKKNTSFDELFEKSQVAAIVDKDGTDFGYNSLDVVGLRKDLLSIYNVIQYEEFDEYDGTPMVFDTFGGSYRAYSGIFTGNQTKPALNIQLEDEEGAYYIVKSNVTSPYSSPLSMESYFEFLDGEKSIEKIQPDTINGNNVTIDDNQLGALIYIAKDSLINNCLAITEIDAIATDDKPLAPENLTTEPGYNVVKLSWNPSSYTGGIKGYNVYRNGSKVNGEEVIGISSYTDYTVSPSTAYKYEVEAVGKDDKISEKVATNVTTLAKPNTTVMAPSIKFVDTDGTGNYATIELQINKPTNTSNIDHYAVVSLDSGMEPEYFENIPTSYANRPIPFQYFVQGTSYLIYAFSVDAAGNYSPASNKIKIKAGNGGGIITETLTPPTKPTNLEATYIGEDEVTLEWSASTSSAGILEYYVYRDGVFVGRTNKTEYTDTGLNDKTEYTYTIEAIDASEENLSSGLSEPLTVLTGVAESAPELVADSTSNTVDASLELTFADNEDWRTNITEIKVDDTVLATSQYSVAPGKISIKQGVITSVGEHEIIVSAKGYKSATIIQTVIEGKFKPEKTIVEVNPTFALGQKSTITVTSKDQYGNLVKGVEFLTDVIVVDNNDLTDEAYTVAGYVYTESDSDLEFTAKTNDKGITTLDISIPDYVDEDDGITIRFKTTDGKKVGSVGYKAGAVELGGVSVDITPRITLGKTSTVTVTAKDVDGKPVVNQQFYADITITDRRTNNDESYTVAGYVYQDSDTNVKIGSRTNSNGVMTFEVGIPEKVDSGDGIIIQLKTDIDGTAIGSPIRYTKSSSGGSSGGSSNGSNDRDKGNDKDDDKKKDKEEDKDKIVVNESKVKKATVSNIVVEIPASAKEKAVYIEADAVNELVTGSKSLTIKANNINMTIPADALEIDRIDQNEEIKISIDELSKDESEDLIEDSINYDGIVLFAVGDRMFELTAEIVNEESGKSKFTFEDDIRVAISLEDETLEGINLDKLGVYCYNDSTEKWDYVGGDYDDNTITFKTDHFSYYSVMQYNKTFADIVNHWAKEDIEIVAAKHIMNGVDENNFQPDRGITRAEFATILVRTMGLDIDNNGYCQFSDVQEDKWYHNYIVAATEAGLINGIDANHFAPNENITREQMSALLERAYVYLYGKIGIPDLPGGKDVSVFTDQNNISTYAQTSVLFVTNLRLVDGRTSTTFEPRAFATRAEVAVALRRFVELNK